MWSKGNFVAFEKVHENSLFTTNFPYMINIYLENGLFANEKVEAKFLLFHWIKVVV